MFSKSFLFSEGKIWIIITVTPLLALGLVIITFYFISGGGVPILKVNKYYCFSLFSIAKLSRAEQTDFMLKEWNELPEVRLL